MLDSAVLPFVGRDCPHFYVVRNKLRKVSLKVSLKYNILPTRLVLQGVRLLDNEQHSAGGFADVFRGVYGTEKVALKRLRSCLMSSESQKEGIRKVSWNTVSLWS